MDDPFTFWIPPIIAALVALFATLYVFWRTQTLRTCERRLSDLYGPLYLFVRRGMPIKGEFWKLMDSVEHHQLIDIITKKNYLASPELLKLIESDIVPVPLADDWKTSISDPFSEQHVRMKFQQLVIEDYRKLRDLYISARRWFLPKIDPQK